MCCGEMNCFSFYKLEIVNKSKIQHNLHSDPNARRSPKANFSRSQLTFFRSLLEAVTFCHTSSEPGARSTAHTAPHSLPLAHCDIQRHGRRRFPPSSLPQSLFSPSSPFLSLSLLPLMHIHTVPLFLLNVHIPSYSNLSHILQLDHSQPVRTSSTIQLT